jgi:hypothetical protein
MFQMILDYDEFCMFLLNIEVLCISLRQYDILDVRSVLVLRKETTSNLTIYGLIQPTIEPKIYRTEMT